MIFLFVYSLTIFVFCKDVFPPLLCHSVWRCNVKTEPILLRENALFCLFGFHIRSFLQATALSNLHFLNEIFPYWILTRCISCRDQPCGFSCINGEQCLCSAGRMLLQGAKPPLGQVPKGPWCESQPQDSRDCAAQSLEPPAWYGGSCRMGRQTAEQEGIKGSAVPQGKALREQGQGRALCWHLPALPAWGHSTAFERGQHQAPHFIKPCAKSETSDAVFPPLHSFLGCFTSHNLRASPYPGWNTNLMNVQSDCYDANKFHTSPGIKHRP